MDEVKAMTHAGETVGRAVGTGLRTLRQGAVQVGQAGAEAAARAATAAEQKLAETGQETARELMATTKQARRDLRKAGQRAGRQAKREATTRMRRIADSVPGLPNTPKRRRWPWLLAILGMAAAGSAAAVFLRRRNDVPVLVDEPTTETEDMAQQRIAGNGAAPEPRREQKQFDRKN